MMKSFRRSGDLAITGANARWYDKNSRQTRLAEMERYAKELSVFLPANAAALEIAPGPGYLSIALSRMGNYHVTGLELSQDFVDIARRNAHNAGVAVDFRQGNAADLPFNTDSFDGIICTAAFKNFREPTKALREIHRVLKPGGTALIIDMNPQITSPQISHYVRDQMHMKGLPALFMQVTFNYFLRKGAYSRDELAVMLREFPLRDCRIWEEDITLHVKLTK
jgi:ubiquinone/menaquinone biosynthesis C-methylase UbiE